MQTECKIIEGYTAPVNAVYNAYKVFCNNNGYKPYNRKNWVIEILRATKNFIDFGENNYGYQKRINYENQRCMLNLRHISFETVQAIDTYNGYISETAKELNAAIDAREEAFSEFPTF